jgi:hypothetical protein
MNHGVNIPKNKRPAMAQRAYEIARASASRVEALLDIQLELDVSEPTARNLIAAGERLATPQQQHPAS